jgi:hypothetical protein
MPVQYHRLNPPENGSSYMQESDGKSGGRGVDLDAVSKLVLDLERDLERVKQGSGNVEALRDEVTALGLALKSPSPDDHTINHGLKNIHGAMDVLKEDAFIAADYATRIGRMLGM